MNYYISTLSFSVLQPEAQNINRPYTIVTADSKADYMDSFVRFLLYANDLNIEELVYSSYMWHYACDGKGTLFTSEMRWTKDLYSDRTDLPWCGTTSVQGLIGEYTKVYFNLVQHDPAYLIPCVHHQGGEQSTPDLTGFGRVIIHVK
jgi:hypothetical protein